jgi:hypothetical protein
VAGDPVISVDTKKKELVGDFANGGKEYRPKGSPVPVRTHGFMDKDLGKAIPYGVYDVAADAGWVNVGTDHDTAAFAVESIRRWWKAMGRAVYPHARQLLVTADAGGSNPAPRAPRTGAPAQAARPPTRAPGLGAPGPDRPGRQRLEPDDQRARDPLPGPARR